MRKKTLDQDNTSKNTILKRYLHTSLKGHLEKKTIKIHEKIQKHLEKHMKKYTSEKDT